MKAINFTPSDFGGYTFFLILSGLMFSLSLIGASLSFICFLIAIYFYEHSNKKDKDEIIKIEE